MAGRTASGQCRSNVAVSKITKFGDQLLSVGGGMRYLADGPDSGAHGLGFAQARRQERLRRLCTPRVSEKVGGDLPFASSPWYLPR